MTRFSLPRLSRPKLPWLQAVRSLGLVFWVLLPLLGLVFWVSSGMVMDQLLSRAGGSVKNPQVSSQEKQLTTQILAIEALVDSTRGVSRVTVRTGNSTLRAFVFEFPFTRRSQIEAAVSRELGVPLTRVQQIIRYRETEDGR